MRFEDQYNTIDQYAEVMDRRSLENSKVWLQHEIQGTQCNLDSLRNQPKLVNLDFDLNNQLSRLYGLLGRVEMLLTLKSQPDPSILN